MRTTADRPIYRSRWWLPGFSLSIGLIMLAASGSATTRATG